MTEGRDGARRNLVERGLATVRGDAQLRRLLHDTSWLTGSNAIALALVLPQGLLVARDLGVSGYGVFVLVTTFVTVADLLTSFRMNEFVVKYVAEALAQDDRSSAAASLKVAMLGEASSALVAFALVWLLAPLGARLFLKSASDVRLIHLFAFIILANAVTESTLGLLQATGRFRLQAKLDAFGQGARTAALVTVYVTSGRLEEYLLAWVGAQVIDSAAYVVAAALVAHRQLGPRWWATPLGVLRGKLGSMARFGAFTNLSASLKVINRTVDPLILGYFRTPAEAGYYRLAYSIVDLSFVPVGPITDVFYPEIARAAAIAAWDDVRRLWRRGSAMVAAWTVPVIVALVTVAPFAIPLVLGRRYWPAITPLLLLIPGIAFANILFWARPSLLALGFAGYATKVNAALTAAKLAASVALVPLLGPAGSAAILTVDLLVNIGLQGRRAQRAVNDREGAGATTLVGPTLPA